jgi:amino acid transporter
VLGVIGTGAIAIIVAFGAETLLGVFGVESPGWHVALAVASLCGITGLVLFGVKAGATFQNACMVAKLTAMAALVVAGLAFFTAAPAEASAATLATSVPIAPGAVTWKGVRWWCGRLRGRARAPGSGS